MKPNSDLLSPVMAFDPERHLFLSADKTVGFAFRCIPAVGGDEAMNRKLAVLLDDEWPAGSSLQFLHYASPNLVKALNNAEFQRSRSGIRQDEEIARASSDWLRRHIDQPFEEMPGLVLRSASLVICAKLPIASQEPTAEELQAAVQARRRLENGLSGLDLAPEALGNDEFVTISSELLNRSPNASWRGRGALSADRHQTLNRQMLDPGSRLGIAPGGITLEGGGHLSLCSPKSFPEAGMFGLMKFLLSDVYAGRRGLRGPFFLSVTVFFPDAQGMKAKLTSKRAYTTNMAYGGLARWVPAVMGRHADMESFFASADNGHRPVRLQMTLGLYGEDKAAADRAVTEAINYWSEHNVVLLEDRYICGPLLISSLPFGADARTTTDLGRCHTMTSEHASILLPVFSSWRGTKTPVISAVGRDGQLMGFDLYDSGAGYNFVVCGETGSGKSVFLQLLTASYLGAGAHIWTIDVGGSYKNLCELMGGEYIDFEGADISLNPFTLIHDFQDECDIVVSLISAMAAPTEIISDHARAVLSTILHELWESHGKELTIDLLAARLKADEDMRIRDLGMQLYPYTLNGQYGRYFQGGATVTFQNRYTVLELGGLQGRKPLQRVVLLQLIFQIQQAMRNLPRDARKILLVDEAWELLADGEVGRFIENGYRRFRKHNAAAGIATQSLGDLYNTEVGVAIAANSHSMFLMKQQPEVIQSLVDQKRLSLGAAETKLLRSVRTEKGRFSEVFFKFGESGDIGRILLDPSTRLLFSSSAGDVASIRRARERGASLDEAVRQVLAAQTPASLAAE